MNFTRHNPTIIIMITILLLCGGCDGQRKTEIKVANKTSTDDKKENKKGSSAPAQIVQPQQITPKAQIVTGTNPSKIWILEEKILQPLMNSHTGQWAGTRITFHCHENGDISNKITFLQEDPDPNNVAKAHEIRIGAQLDWREITKVSQVKRSDKPLKHRGLMRWAWTVNVEFTLHESVIIREGIQAHNSHGKVVMQPTTDSKDQVGNDGDGK